MLILTRRPGEAIQVGDEIEISVLEIRGNQVRLGINAPAEVLVLRSELLQTAAETAGPNRNGESTDPTPQH